MRDVLSTNVSARSTVRTYGAEFAIIRFFKFPDVNLWTGLGLEISR